MSVQLLHALRMPVSTTQSISMVGMGQPRQAFILSVSSKKELSHWPMKACLEPATGAMRCIVQTAHGGMDAVAACSHPVREFEKRVAALTGEAVR